MKIKVWIIGILAAALGLSGFLAAGADKKMRVVTSLPSLAAIARAVGGEHVQVTSISKGSQDAHYIEAKPSYMVELSKADLLIYSGMELEIGWLPLLIQGARNNRVAVGGSGQLNTSAALGPEDVLEKPRGELDRTMGDVHPLGNPHFLTNPHNIQKVAALVRDKLAELDPDHAESYAENHRLFDQELSGRIAQWEAKGAVLRGMEIVSYHPDMTYFNNWMGISVVKYIELRPGIPPSPQHRQEVEKTMKDKNIKVVTISSWKEPTPAREVAESNGAELVILPAELGAMEGTDDCIAWIDYLVTKMVEAQANTAGEGGP